MKKLENLDKLANSSGWYFSNFRIKDTCVSCNKNINEGYLRSPSMNYPICVSCAEKEFNGCWK